MTRPTVLQKGTIVMPDPEEVLRTKKTYALIGATQDMLKYSYELFFTMLDHNYTVYPINPRYESIEDRRCYPSLAHLPEKPEVVIVTLSPLNAENVLSHIAEQGIRTVWFPPGSCSEAVLERAQAFGLEIIHNVCPIGTLRRMDEGGTR
jgi:predicted CoA-binding protein